MQEIWKSLKNIVDYGDNYEVSNLGRVKSTDREIETVKGKRRLKGKIMKQVTDVYGYKKVTFCIDYKSRTYSIHRLVAITFLENTENKPEVNHKDGNKQNNNLENLEWSTSKENINHAWENGLVNNVNIGENNNCAKLTEQDILKIRKMYNTGDYRQKEIADIFNVGTDTISDIVTFKTWKHVGGDVYISKDKKSKNLTIDNVKMIRKMYAEKTYTQSKLAEIFDTSRFIINQIVNYKSWKHVD